MYISETKELISQPNAPVSSTTGNGSPTHRKQHCRLAGSSIYQQLMKWIEHNIGADAFYFGVRMSVCLTISSLFVLVQAPSDKHHFPEGMWVLITVLFVCWFPTLDAASVLEKSIQRLIGTLIGASLGLLCGFVSIFFADRFGVHAQAISIVVQLAIVSFSACSYAVKKKFLPRYNYSVILLILTYAICLMPFYSVVPNWRRSIFRIVNVIIGCFLGEFALFLGDARPDI